MSEPTIDQIQAAIKRRLDTINGLRALAHEPDYAVFPSAYPRLVDWTYDYDLDQTTLYHFDIWVLVGLEPGWDRAQTILNPFLSASGANSIKCLIDADPRLGGTVASARATGGGQYGETTIAKIRALSGSVRIEVLT